MAKIDEIAHLVVLDRAIALADSYDEEAINKVHKEGRTFNSQQWLEKILEAIDDQDYGIHHWKEIDGG